MEASKGYIADHDFAVKLHKMVKINKLTFNSNQRPLVLINMAITWIHWIKFNIFE